MTQPLYQQLIEAAKHGDAPEVARLTKNPGEPLNWARAVRWAVHNGHLECLKILLHAQNILDDAPDILILAASQGHLHCVEHLLTFVDPLYNNSMAMVVAAGNGHVKCLRTLMHVCDCENHGYTALLESAQNGHIECAQILAEILPNDCLKQLRECFAKLDLDMTVVDQLDGYAQRTRLIHEVDGEHPHHRRKI